MSTYYNGNPEDPLCAPGPMVYDPADGYVVDFAACMSGWVKFVSCTYTFHDGTWSNITGSDGTNPPPLVNENFVWDAVDSYALLFGGIIYPTGRADYQFEWTFSDGHWQNLSGVTTPPSRLVPSVLAAYDSSASEIVTAASNWVGNATVRYCQTTSWTYHGGAWTNITGGTFLPPYFPCDARIADDPSDGGVLLFGGTNSTTGTASDASWMFSSGAWHEVPTSASPPAYGSPSMVYDSIDGYVLLTGGSSGPCGVTVCLTQGEDWTFSHGTWANVTSQVKGDQPVQTGGAMVSDPKDGYVLEGYGETGVVNDNAQEQQNMYSYAALSWNVVTLSGSSSTSSPWWGSTLEEIVLFAIVPIVGVAVVVVALLLVRRRRRRSHVTAATPVVPVQRTDVAPPASPQCPNCGAPIQAGWAFCPRCTRPLTNK
jgi:hypothetical protein